ncbi:hypothetical protein [Pseudoalteromonas distincta]|uniref:hypothetical protein n=1 Tax=Pseudoalteromonas distincta TaxID=77608 RepID=UPI0032E1C082
MTSTYPKIIISNNEIELIEHANDLYDFTYNLDEQQKFKVIVLDMFAGYQSLSGEEKKPLKEAELGHLVKVHLAKEGQCCLDKINNLTPEQAFKLLYKVY